MKSNYYYKLVDKLYYMFGVDATDWSFDRVIKEYKRQIYLNKKMYRNKIRQEMALVNVINELHEIPDYAITNIRDGSIREFRDINRSFKKELGKILYEDDLKWEIK